MVLWEIAVATAYFMGLKRTYRLALGMQRRLFGPRNPRIRQFLRRRTRAIFDVAVNVHQSIQQRDIEAGRNIGNWVLRLLNRMKPSAEIRFYPVDRCIYSPVPKQASIRTQPLISQKPYAKIAERLSRGRLLFARWNMRPPKSSPTIAMMMLQPMRPLSMNNVQLRQLCCHTSLNHGCSRFGGVFRQDIALWMQSY
ncbi:hypothetical protein AXF42_Ash002027 [Apostasia shenzhenica]|uniref:Uncharacterized protein n=1 Tax=Apostasia shenzhenica TaxID=1088818 RepID=A0A2I0AC11_9ASPA|nr:hypothetical protein AXF42_Ash002027 [Apostasia shenzhenica]